MAGRVDSHATKTLTGHRVTAGSYAPRHPGNVVAAAFATIALATIGLAAPSPAEAVQNVTGTVRLAETLEPVAGAFVNLLDAGGESVHATFTSAAGQFSLSSRSPGEFRVTVDQIGYSEWRSEPIRLQAGSPVNLRAEVVRRPLLMETLEVRVVRACLDDPSQAAAFAGVWEEIKRALETAEWAERQGQLTFDITEYDRELEPNSLRIRDARTRSRGRVRLPPFRSPSAEQLATSGYAVLRADTTVFYAPDATVLLSQSFQDTHCFGLTRSTLEDRPVVGVTFATSASSEVVDVEGTLWVDEESSELRRVELHYRNLPLPRGADRRLVGANLTFARLPNGPFYVREWWIRFPVWEQVVGFGALANVGRRQAVLAAYHQTGGSVGAAFFGGAPVFDAIGATVRGIVYDSAAGTPLVGAEVSLRKWADAARFVPIERADGLGRSALTDSAGTFEIVGVPDGLFAIRLDHPRMVAAGVRFGELSLVVADGQAAPVDLVLPSQETIYGRICPSSRPQRAYGAIVGLARSESTGMAVPGVRIMGRWNVNRISASRSGDVRLSTRSEGVDAVTDDVGRFVLCKVPIGETVFVTQEGRNRGVSLTQDARVVWQDLPVEPPEPR